MRIVLKGEAKMPPVFRDVDCLTHAAQDHDFYLREIGAVAALRQQGGKLFRRGIIQRTLPFNAALAEKIYQFAKSFGAGMVMHAVKRRQFVATNVFGGADIGNNHAFFNQTVRFEAVARLDGFNLAFAVVNKFRLARMEINDAARQACRPQNTVNGLQIVQWAL